MTTIFISRSILLLLASLAFLCNAETLDTTEGHAEEEEEEKRQNIAEPSSFLPLESTLKPIDKLNNNALWSRNPNNNNNFSAEYDELHEEAKKHSPENSVDKDSLENVNYFLQENPDIENTTFPDLKRIRTTTTTTTPDPIPEFREENDEATSVEVPSGKEGSNCADGDCKVSSDEADVKAPPATTTIPLWNMVRSVKPLERSSAVTPFVEYVDSTSVQTSDNVILETEVAKVDESSSAANNKSERFKPPGKVEGTPGDADVTSESTLPKVTIAPTASYPPKETSIIVPDLRLLSSFLHHYSKILSMSSPSPTTTEETLVGSVSDLKPIIASSDIFDEKQFLNIPSIEISKEILDFTTPLSSVVPTVIKFDVKSSVVFPSKLKPTNIPSENPSISATPIAYPSVSEIPSPVMTSSSVVSVESILPSFSTSLVTPSFQMTSPTAIVTTPLETDSPYQNVIPVVQESTVLTSPKVKPPPPRLSNPSCSNLPVCIEVSLLDSSWEQFCGQLPDFREFLSQSVSRYTRPVPPHHIALEQEDECERARGGGEDVKVALYVVDQTGEYEERMTEICGLVLRKWGPTAFRGSVMEVRLYSSESQSTPLPLIPELNSGFVAAVSISAVAGVALCLLCILLVVMKQKMMQARNSDTTTPTADAYSLDSLSINASFRRRRTRRSARSYLNHAFSDQEIPSHPLSEKTLVNCLKSRDLLEEEFKKIPLNMPKLDAIPEGAHVKNRYSNILPRPESRVVLAEPSGDPLKCYINANFVKGYEGKSAFYIACQAPLPEGIEDFWRMVWEQQCRAIVMLTQFEENGISRCAMYFPQSTLVNQQPFGDFQVSLLKKEVYEFYTMSTLRLLDLEKNLFRDIVHLWFNGWPDVGVPKDPSSLITFVQQCRPYINCNSGPTVIHCSTGTGRTGVFLALDIVMREYEESRSIDILQCVSQLRRDRGGAVQNKDQYILIYEAMLEYITRVANQSECPSLNSKNS